MDSVDGAQGIAAAAERSDAPAAISLAESLAGQGDVALRLRKAGVGDGRIVDVRRER